VYTNTQCVPCDESTKNSMLTVHVCKDSRSWKDKNLLAVEQSCAVCEHELQEEFLRDVPDRLRVVPENSTYVRCSGCGLISLYPRPSFEQTASFYPPAFWRTEAHQDGKLSVFKRFEAWFRDRLVGKDFAIIERFFRSGLKHLDVGCATGDFILLCQSRGVISSGIEMSTSAAEYCRSQRKLDVVAADLVKHEFGGRKFDVITYNGVLEHLPNPFEHLIKRKELLNPGGKLIILGLPNIRSAGFRLAGKDWIGLDSPRHIHQFSTESLGEILRHAGFQILEMDFRSPRFNPPSLIASVFPALHRHKFDEYEARTGKNPILRKAVLFALLQLVRPLDWSLARLGFGEHMTCVASLKGD